MPSIFYIFPSYILLCFIFKLYSLSQSIWNNYQYHCFSCCHRSYRLYIIICSSVNKYLYSKLFNQITSSKYFIITVQVSLIGLKMTNVQWIIPFWQFQILLFISYICLSIHFSYLLVIFSNIKCKLKFITWKINREIKFCCINCLRN